VRNSPTNSGEEAKKEARQRAFLTAFGETATVTAAARAAKIARSCHYAWLAEPGSDYPERFAEAHEVAADALESEARRRAVEGTTEDVFFQDEKVGVRR
jgi:hypothetical protein